VCEVAVAHLCLVPCTLTHMHAGRRDTRTSCPWHRMPRTHTCTPRFVKGTIEQLDAAGVAPGSVDIIISNCVVNLSPDKPAVLRQAHRALADGGEMYFSGVRVCGRVHVWGGGGAKLGERGWVCVGAADCGAPPRCVSVPTWHALRRLHVHCHTRCVLQQAPACGGAHA
jgi:hypothetical protein